MKSKPLFSVIIPTCNRNDLLAKCLDCLAPGAQTLSKKQYEVIVTDDNSKTTAKEMIQKHYHWAKWVQGQRKGPAANRNNGAKYAKGVWLVFTDDDCLPDNCWLESYKGAIHKNTSYSVFEGRTRVNAPRKSLAERAPINETGGYLWSCNFAIKKHFFKSLNGFDERFPYAHMEDVDLRLRIKKRGCAFLFVKSASVRHPWNFIGNWKEFKKKFKENYESTLIYLSIHPKESHNINSMIFLRGILRKLIKVTIPGIILYKGKGIKEELFHHIGSFQMAFLLFYRKLKKINSLCIKGNNKKNISRFLFEENQKD